MTAAAPPGQHPAIRAIAERRSWRIYMDAPLDDLTAAELARAAELAPSVDGRRAARVEIVADPDRARHLTRAITRGVLGKTNVWLFSSPPPAYAVVVADARRGARHGDRHLYNVDAAMAGEMVCLAAAERHLGSCWMAAISMKHAARFLDLDDDGRVPAVIALGEPGERRRGALLASGWHRFTYRNKRRRTMAEIVHLDRFGSGRTLPEGDLARMGPDGRDLLALLDQLRPAREFGGAAPSPDQLARVFEAARIAPSADNAQTWRFVLWRDRDDVRRVLRDAGVAWGATLPGALVAVAAAPFVIKRVHGEQPFALIDHPIALTHAMIAAEVMGLRWGAWFAFDHASVRDRAGFPARHEVTALLGLDADGSRVDGAPPPWVQLW